MRERKKDKRKKRKKTNEVKKSITKRERRKRKHFYFPSLFFKGIRTNRTIPQELQKISRHLAKKKREKKSIEMASPVLMAIGLHSEFVYGVKTVR